MGMLLVILSVSFFIFGTFRNVPYKIESDGKYYYQYLISIFFDGDLDFNNNYRAPAYVWMESEVDHYRLRESLHPVTQRPVNPFSSGPAVLWSLPFLLLYGLGRLLVNLGATWPDLNPWSRYFQYGVMYAGVLYCIAGLCLTHSLLRRWVEERVARASLVLVLFASSLFYYTVFEVSMSHVYDFFTMALFVVTYVRCREAPVIKALPRHFVAGLAAGLHVLVRPQNFATVAIFFLFLALGSRRDGWRPALARPGVFALGLGIAMVPMLAANHALRGSVFANTHGSSFFRPLAPHLVDTLFSSRNGLFFFHPVLLFGLLGAVLAWWHARHDGGGWKPVLAPLLLSFAAQWFINSIAVDWWAGASFGLRRFVSSNLVFAMGLAWLLQQLQDRWPGLSKGLTKRLVAYPVVLNLYLTLLYVFDYTWAYGEPKNVFALMFWDAPVRGFWLVHTFLRSVGLG